MLPLNLSLSLSLSHIIPLFPCLLTLFSLVPPRNEIRSGTAVTYNDRQEILCQLCTNTTLRDRGSDDSRHSEQSTPTNERADRPSEEPEIPSQRERENGGEHVDPLLDFSKIQDINPAVRARLGSKHTSSYFLLCSISLSLCIYHRVCRL